MEEVPEKKAKIVATRSGTSDVDEVRKKWDSEVGDKLFDIKCDKMIKSQVNGGYCFDFDFYEDQKSNRSQVMQTRKVDKAFQEGEKKRNNRLSRQYIRRLSAYGIQKESTEAAVPPEDSEEEEPNEATAGSEEISYSNQHISAPVSHSIVQTRNQSAAVENVVPKQLVSVGTQHQYQQGKDKYMILNTSKLLG